MERTPDVPRRYAEEKGRVPSYCDRILYRSLAPPPTPAFYRSAFPICTSDHAPVGVLFSLKPRADEFASPTPQPTVGTGPIGGLVAKVVLADISFRGLSVARLGLKGNPPVTLVQADARFLPRVHSTMALLPTIDVSVENVGNDAFDVVCGDRTPDNGSLVLAVPPHLRQAASEPHACVLVTLVNHEKDAPLAHALVPLFAGPGVRTRGPTTVQV